MHKIKITTWFEISNTKQGSHHKLHNSISHQNKLPAKNCSATAESQQMLPAATSGCHFTSHCTVAEDDSPGTGKFPPDQICVKQAAGNLKSVQFQADLLHLLDQRQQVNPFWGGNLCSPWKISQAVSLIILFVPLLSTSATSTQQTNKVLYPQNQHSAPLFYFWVSSTEYMI